MTEWNSNGVNTVGLMLYATWYHVIIFFFPIYCNRTLSHTHTHIAETVFIIQKSILIAYSLWGFFCSIQFFSRFGFGLIESQMHCKFSIFFLLILLLFSDIFRILLKFSIHSYETFVVNNSGWSFFHWNWRARGVIWKKIFMEIEYAARYTHNDKKWIYSISRRQSG